MSDDFLRLKTTPKPATPSQGAVDLFYDKTAGVFKTRDFDGPTKSLVSGDGAGVSDAAAFRTELSCPANNPTGITGASAITNIVSLSQGDYDLLGSTDPSTLYVITA